MCLPFIFVSWEKWLLTWIIILVLAQLNPSSGSSTLHQYRTSCNSQNIMYSFVPGSLQCWAPFGNAFPCVENAQAILFTIVLKSSPLINSSTSECPFPCLGPSVFCRNLVIQTLTWYSQLFPQFSFPTRFYKFVEGRDYVLSVGISSGNEEERLNTCVINYLSE